jgi:hypothetical protein
VLSPARDINLHNKSAAVVSFVKIKTKSFDLSFLLEKKSDIHFAI